MTIEEALALAKGHHHAGRLALAEPLYRQIVQAQPNHAEALALLGVLAHQSGRHEQARAYMEQAIQSDPRQAFFHSNLGVVYQALGHIDEAIACYRQALRLQPDNAEAHNNLGNVFLHQGQLDEAAACYRKALHLRPDYPEALNNLGNTLLHQGKLAETIARLEEALRLRPDIAEAHNNLGIALLNQGKLDEALTHFRQALQLKPDYAEAYSNQGLAFERRGKPDEAIASLEQALRLRPDYAEAHHNLGLQLLLRGDMERGWQEFERGRKSRSPGAATRPWDGSPLAGRTLLVHADQGFGDSLQFVRYAALLRKQGARVLLRCQAGLQRLLQACPGVDGILSLDGPLPAFDVDTPLASLPRLLGTTSLDRIPSQVPYLELAPELVERWRARLRPVAGFRVGIAWQGNAEHQKNDDRRSAPLERFAVLARVPGVRLISLQKGTGSEQLRQSPGLALDLEPELTDFAETAAVMRCLDLVISVDTAVVHCAGGLGVPVWVALPFAPDWRWLLDRPDSPWYPSMRLFRQKQPGQWPEVFERLATEFRQFASARAGGS